MFSNKPRHFHRPHERTRPPRKLVIRESTLGVFIICVFALIFALLVIKHAGSTSATYDETTHLPSGYTYLQWGDYRLNPEHPPLIKKLAALFVTWQNPWPQNLEMSEMEFVPRPGSDSSLEIKRFWALGLDQIDTQWIFGHYFLYGPKAETIQRYGVRNPLQVPTKEALERRDFLNNADNLLFWGRMAIMGLGVLLAALVFLWARELWGLAGGVLAIALFCFDPNFIAHSGLVTTDVGVTAFMFGAVYFLWRACRRLNVLSVILMVLFFGLAFASKFTSVLLVPIFVLAVLGRVFSNKEWVVGNGKHKLVSLPAKALVMAGLFAAAAAAAYVTVWASYDFRYSAAKDPAAAARAESWVMPLAKPAEGKSGEPTAEKAKAEKAKPPAVQSTRWREPGHFPIEYVVRRTAATQAVLKDRPEGAPEQEIEALLDSAPIGLSGRLILFAQGHKLLPEAYLYGFAHAQMKSLMRGSFLNGEFSNRGFWNYFLWTFMLKTPLVTLAAVAAGLFFAFRRREPWRSRMAFLLVPVVVYWGVSMSSSLNIGHRHLLPIYPFLFVLAGGLAMEWAKLRPHLKPRVAWLSLAAIAISGSVVFVPLWKPAVVYPHYLAYFNELAGGPRKGYESLVDSNLDWGQDLKKLKIWIDKRHITEPIYLCYFGMADPRYHGISHINVPKILGGFPMEPSPYEQFESKGQFKEAIDQFARDLRDGTYVAISATNRVGVYASPQVRAIWQQIIDQSVLVDQIGYSIFIYKLSPPTR